MIVDLKNVYNKLRLFYISIEFDERLMKLDNSILQQMLQLTTVIISFLFLIGHMLQLS